MRKGGQEEEEGENRYGEKGSREEKEEIKKKSEKGKKVI